MEEFARIEGHTRYHASSEGYIVNVETGLRLKTGKDGRVTLYRGGERSYRTVARLVADAFQVPPMHTFAWVLHRDGDSSNDRPENLYRGTSSDMLHDIVARGNHRTASRTHCKNGHEYTDKNTDRRVRKDGRRERVCITCRRVYQRERSERLREARR